MEYSHQAPVSKNSSVQPAFCASGAVFFAESGVNGSVLRYALRFLKRSLFGPHLSQLSFSSDQRKISDACEFINIADYFDFQLFSLLKKAAGASKIHGHKEIMLFHLLMEFFKNPRITEFFEERLEMDIDLISRQLADVVADNAPASPEIFLKAALEAYRRKSQRIALSDVLNALIAHEPRFVKMLEFSGIGDSDQNAVGQLLSEYIQGRGRKKTKHNVKNNIVWSETIDLAFAPGRSSLINAITSQLARKKSILLISEPGSDLSGLFGGLSLSMMETCAKPLVRLNLSKVSEGASSAGAAQRLGEAISASLQASVPGVVVEGVEDFAALGGIYAFDLTKPLFDRRFARLPILVSIDKARVDLIKDQLPEYFEIMPIPPLSISEKLELLAYHLDSFEEKYGLKISLPALKYWAERNQDAQPEQVLYEFMQSVGYLKSRAKQPRISRDDVRNILFTTV